MAAKSCVYNVGSPTTVSFDLSKVSVDLVISESSRDIHECWGEEFVKHPRVTVMLSGGLDSQFSALLAKRHCEDVDAAIFHFVWDNTVINAHDVLAAQRFAVEHNIPIQNIEIDVKHCLDNELERICKNYISASPQIAVHLYCVEKISDTWDQTRTLLMGGEVPLIACDGGSLVMPAYRNKDGKITDKTVDVTYAKSLLPFAILSSQKNIDIIRDPFCMSPEIFYLAYAHNADVFERSKKVVDIGDFLRTEITDYKQAYYELLVDGLMPQLLKRTGFELLRYAMAVRSGTYDRFDKVYRQHAVTAVKSRKQRGSGIVESLPKIQGPIHKIADLCTSSLEKHKPTPCNLYVFDW